MLIIKALKPGSIDANGLLWQTAYYLCYINSTLNPLCYALCNQNFRETYYRILTCRFSKRNNILPSELAVRDQAKFRARVEQAECNSRMERMKRLQALEQQRFH
ncbi:hypothetical protein BLOT_012969 [Blomia tropicalis]|nr:hypothetical protein BLOT_012969 [Blomia tropicalis]